MRQIERRLVKLEDWQRGEIPRLTTVRYDGPEPVYLGAFVVNGVELVYWGDEIIKLLRGVSMDDL